MGKVWVPDATAFYVGPLWKKLLKNDISDPKSQKWTSGQMRRFEFRDGGKWKVDVQIKRTPRLPNQLQNSKNSKGATEKATKLPAAANRELCGGGSRKAPFGTPTSDHTLQTDQSYPLTGSW